MKNKIKFIKWYDFRNAFYLDESVFEKILQYIKEDEKNILDLYCKTGVLTIKLAKERPNCQLIGMDDHFKFLRLAKRSKRKNVVKNVEFMNASNLNLREETFNSILLYFALSDRTLEESTKLLTSLYTKLSMRCQLIIIDYGQIESEFRKKCRQLFFNKNQKSFLELDLSQTLHNIGYKNVKIERMNGIQIIRTEKSI